MTQIQAGALLFPTSCAWKLTDLSFSGLSPSTHYHQNNFLKHTSIPLFACLKCSKAPHYFTGVRSCSRQQKHLEELQKSEYSRALCVKCMCKQLPGNSNGQVVLVSNHWGLASPTFPSIPTEHEASSSVFPLYYFVDTSVTMWLFKFFCHPHQTRSHQKARPPTQKVLSPVPNTLSRR